MSPNKRIFVNIVATYGRSLYALVIGLFCGRWALMALGEVDYGLYGLVGGMTGFVAFFNELLAMAVGRFYAVSIGSAHKTGNEITGLEDCRKWFNTAFCIHTLVPLGLVIIGYPVGTWAVANFLTIPVDRVGPCLWVWRFTCFSCFVGMMNVPFAAMYNAKQEIAELTIYKFVTATVNVVFLYYMLTHPGIWITKYAFWMMMLGVAPQVIIAYRAIIKYPECRFCKGYLWNVARMLDISKFALARFWTAFSGMISAQGNSILVNKYLGPQFNASIAVGNSVAGHASTLSNSLSGAFSPVIGNKAGEGEEDEVRKFAFRTCRFGSALMLVFAIPLAIEIDEVLHLWLKIPPEGAAIICLAVLIDMLLERTTEGHWMAIMSVGRGISLYSVVMSIAGFSRLAIAWCAFALGYGLQGLFVALVIARCVACVARLILGRKLVGMSIRYWACNIFMPLMLIVVVTCVIGMMPSFYFPPSIFRVCETAALCGLAFLPLAWFVVLTGAEREFFMIKIRQRFMKE